MKIEKEIEDIIKNKVFKKTEKIKDKEFTKYEVFANLYNKQKKVFREKDPSSKISIIKEINSLYIYKEADYPYDNSFLYSYYLDEAFLIAELEDKEKENYPVLNLYLNKEKMKKGINKEFLIFNDIIKLLLNEWSIKCPRSAVKKLISE